MSIMSFQIAEGFLKHSDDLIRTIKKNRIKAVDKDGLIDQIKKFKNKADEILETSSRQTKKSRKFGRIFRVQGGDGANASKFRFIIKNKKIEVIGDDMLHVTFDDTYRPVHFWTKRGRNAEVFTAEIESSFIEKIKREAVKQNRAKEFPNKPQIDDPTLTNGSFGIPNNYFDELIKSIKKPTILKD